MNVYGILYAGPTIDLTKAAGPFEEGEPLEASPADLDPKQARHGHITDAGRITHACVAASIEPLLERVGSGSLRTLAGMACKRCGGAIATGGDS